MRMRKALSGLLALMLCVTVLVVPAMAFSDEDEEQKPAVEVTEPEPEVEVTEPEAEVTEPEPVTGGIEPEPLTPEGNMTLVDDIDGEAAGDKHFIVVQSRNGHYFYIIIDHASEGENTVHFLNQVDEADLLSLIEAEEQAPVVCSCTTKCAAGAVNTSCAVCAVNMSECVGVEPEPEEPDTPDEPDTPEEPEEKGGGNPLMIVVVLAVLGAGGAVAYLKFFKKKPNVKGSDDLDSYDYGDDDQDEPEDDEDELGDDEDPDDEPEDE